MQSEVTERKAGPVKKQRAVSRGEFSTAVLHQKFEKHVSDAQNAFLKGDSVTAEAEATLALRIRPTAHLFAFLAVIAESKGQFDRASDFRLLQAFLARDQVLWEELLHEFLSNQLYYKSVVCLQRMSAMEKTDAQRYRTLQLQLTDLLIGLGETRRAADVLVGLWEASEYRDFEVFALLSSLYFQLHKWGPLEQLITASLQQTFHLANGRDDAAALSATPGSAATGAEGDVSGGDGFGSSATTAAPARSKRVSKRVRFFGISGGGGGGEGEEEEEEEGVGTHGDDSDKTVTGGSAASAAAPWEGSSTCLDPDQDDGDDDFNFDDAALGSVKPQSVTGPSPSSPSSASLASRGGGRSRGSMLNTALSSTHSLYNAVSLRLRTESERRNFQTLVNVLAELLNELGRYQETVRLVDFTAACLNVPLLGLPPDLLVRLGTAYALDGGHETQCRQVFEHLMQTCSMEEYGDVLLDAAVILQRVGMYADAIPAFEVFARYHQFLLNRLTPQLAEAERALQEEEASMARRDGAEGVALAGSQSLHRLRQLHAELRGECDEVITVLASAYYRQAQCCAALPERVSESAGLVRQALSVDPAHLQARLMLGRISFNEEKNLEAAVAALMPRDGEPALQRIQLGAALVRLFHRAEKYVEAIALGVSIFQLILSSAEDGDTQSVAPGSTRRSTTASALRIPTTSRASSAILPPTSLGGVLSQAAAAASSRRSFSLAASIRAGTSLSRQLQGRRGRAALTTTVYGASAAASVAAGWSREEEEERVKDSSTIFRFNRKRRRPAGSAGVATSGEDGGGADAEAESRRKQRRVEVMEMPADQFWGLKGGAGADGGDSSDPIVTAAVEGSPIKMEEATSEEEAGVPPRPPSPGPPQKAGKVITTRKPHEDKRQMKLEEAWANDTATVDAERDRDLAELEAFEHDAVEEAEGPLPESYELPSLEDISHQFEDPAMAELFLSASVNTPVNAVVNPWDPAALAAAAEGVSDSANDRVTAREVLDALGKREFMALAVCIVDCYSALGKFTEVKEFAFLVLSRFSKKRSFPQMSNLLERPLRLAILRAAMAAGEAEDAYRVGIRLFQEDTTPEQRDEVVELLHGVLSRCADRSSVLYRFLVEGGREVPLLVLQANRYYQTRSYTRVLNLYLAALAQRPHDVFLNYMVGLAYLLCSHQKKTRARESCVSAAVYYLSQYQPLVMAVDTARTGEALYNTARALHFLRLHHLCVPLYERVAYGLVVPLECTAALRRAARINLYFILRWVSGNRAAALTALSASPFA